MMKSRLFAAFLAAVFLVTGLTGCGIRRSISFQRSKTYFTNTAPEQHTPGEAGRKAWWVIYQPNKSYPYLLKKIQSDDIVDAGTAIILLQTIGGRKYQAELLEAVKGHDWEGAPGFLGTYVQNIVPLIEEGVPGPLEK